MPQTPWERGAVQSFVRVRAESVRREGRKERGKRKRRRKEGWRKERWRKEGRSERNWQERIKSSILNAKQHLSSQYVMYFLEF